jgi:hypothetical protein
LKNFSTVWNGYGHAEVFQNHDDFEERVCVILDIKHFRDWPIVLKIFLFDTIGPKATRYPVPPASLIRR